MKNHSNFERGELTAYLLTTLGDTVLVGDGEAPKTGGWDDDPSLPDSSYVPYVVLLPLPAQRGSGSFGDSASEWHLGYSLTAYGVSREQVEFYAGISRAKLLGLSRVTISLDSVNWQIVQAEVNSIGGVSRNDQTEPSVFSEIDVVTLWMSKEL